MSDKKLYSFRLTKDASDALDSLSEAMGINRTSVIEVIIRKCAKSIEPITSEGIPIAVGDLFTVEDHG